MEKFPKPRIVVSRCLEFEPVRYNGQIINDTLISKLKNFVEFIPICPEVEIGLGTPRDPIRIVENQGQKKLIQPSTGLNLTEDMNNFSQSFLTSINHVDGFILKHSSPSCGIGTVKIYNEQSEIPNRSRANGFFGEAVLERFGGLAIEDEGRLKNFNIREHFLTKVFTLARFREVVKQEKRKDLVEFQKNHKYLFMSYNQAGLKRLGQIVADLDKLTWEESLNAYREELEKQFKTLPRYTSMINVMYHIFGGFSKHLQPKEKQFFDDKVHQYREQKIPSSVIMHLLEAWAIRFEQQYLLDQVIFNPFPRELVEVTDSGKGRIR